MSARTIAFMLCALCGCAAPDTGAGNSGSGSTSGSTGGAPASSSGGEPMTTSPASSGGTGGSAGGKTGGTGGAEINLCPNLAAFDPVGSYASPVGPYTDEIGGFFGARLSDEPLKVAIACDTLVVGIASFSNPDVCTVPAEVAVSAWSDIGIPEEETGAIVPAAWPAPTTLALAQWESFGDSKQAQLHRLPYPATFAAGEYPFAAIKLAPLLCGVLSQTECSGAEAIRYRPADPGAGWSPLSHAKSAAPPSVPDLAGYQLVIGMTDCVELN